jgi:poly(ribitol-phosphate) beta-N-acetylglucosaminyltransferase
MDSNQPITARTRSAQPKVSVIIPVHNTERYIERCVMSAVRQTIGVGRLEIIAIDDGSTDGTGAVLDRLAADLPALTVIHQEASGGASRPRNVGLDHASGEFVFFLDSDDHLGTEALERMVAMAERGDSDVVLGKTVSPGGRHVAQDLFRHSQADADLFTSAVYYTLNPLKLFRRSLIDRLGLRFPEDVRIGEDHLFVAHAYLHAHAISVVADYDCYYWTRRTDGSSLTQRGADYFERLPQTEQVIELIAAHTEPGVGRDHLIARHLRLEVLKRFNKRFLGMPADEQRRLTAEIKKVLDRWTTADVRRRLDVRWRLRAYCVQHDLFDELLEVVRFDLSGEKAGVVREKGRVYAAHPLFRRGVIPDDCFDRTLKDPPEVRLNGMERKGTVVTLSGRATWGPDDDQRVELVLREWTTGEEHRLPAGAPGFEVEVDLATVAGGRPLRPGLWDVSVAVTGHGMTSETRLGRDRADHLRKAPPTWEMPLAGDAPVPVGAYYTKPHGNLTFDVADTRNRPPGDVLTVDDVVMNGPATLTVTGRRTSASEVRVRLTDPDGTVHTVPAETHDDGGFTATVPLLTVADGGPLPAGLWTVTLHTERDGLGHTVRIAPRPGMSAAWRHDGRRHRAAAVTSGRLPGLTLRVTTARARRIRALRRLRRILAAGSGVGRR